MSLQKIERIVVLMLENRSFDHVFGFLKATNPSVAGLNGDEFNQRDPNTPTDAKIQVKRVSSFIMKFDPAHEFYDVKIQRYGVLPGTDPSEPPIANPAIGPAPMTGFVANAVNAVDIPGDEKLVMECFEADQLPVLTTLAKEFGLFNYYYSSLPGPTWPNRFFVHAATSGGLIDSPTTTQILAGFDFQNKTIYERLADAKKEWCIYHDGLPQTAGISSLRDEYVDPFTENFQDMEDFFDDVKNADLPDYAFIEPKYDTGNNFLDGNSMHPLNDIRKGEKLVRDVYEALRNSDYWNDTMLIITFDEHGGFYDHQSPPAAVPPGDENKYARPGNDFDFQSLGVRVPAIVISAYTQKGTIIGNNPNDAATTFDHSSVLATVGKCFGLKALTKRDAAAKTLDIAINLANPRLSPIEALMHFPRDAAEMPPAQPAIVANVPAAAPTAALSANQKTMTALALACDIQINPEVEAALISNHQKLVEQRDAAKYIEHVGAKVSARRKAVGNPP